MITWIQQNIQNILIVIGAACVLFYPQLKKQLEALTAGGGEEASKPNGSGHVHGSCPCCCVPEPVQEKTRTEWVADVMAVRIYVDKRKLPEAVEACDTLIHEIVSGRPQLGEASVTVAKVTR